MIVNGPNVQVSKDLVKSALNVLWTTVSFENYQIKDTWKLLVIYKVAKLQLSFKSISLSHQLSWQRPNCWCDVTI